MAPPARPWMDPGEGSGGVKIAIDYGLNDTRTPAKLGKDWRENAKTLSQVQDLWRARPGDAVAGFQTSPSEPKVRRHGRLQRRGDSGVVPGA